MQRHREQVEKQVPWKGPGWLVSGRGAQGIGFSLGWSPAASSIPVTAIPAAGYCHYHCRLPAAVANHCTGPWPALDLVTEVAQGPKPGQGPKLSLK